MVFVYLADGFEELEAITVITVMRRAAIDVRTVSVSDSRTVTGSKGIAMESDILIKDADYGKCEMIVLPGGGQGTANLGKNALVVSKVKEFAAAGKWVAAICAAPAVLGQAGVLAGHEATVYPGGEQQLTGAKVVADKVVVSGNIVTSRGPGTALDFAFALTGILKGETAADKVKSQMLLV